MKKILWLALLLPTMAFADDEYELQIFTELATQTPILQQIESNTASGNGDTLGPVPIECDAGAFAVRDGVEIYPDGTGVWVSSGPNAVGVPGAYSTQFWQTEGLKDYFITIVGGTRGIVARPTGSGQLNIAYGWPLTDNLGVIKCLHGLVEAGRL